MPPKTSRAEGDYWTALLELVLLLGKSLANMIGRFKTRNFRLSLEINIFTHGLILTYHA